VAELKDYLTVRQVARALKRDKSSVIRYIQKGYLRAERLAGRYLIERTQLMDFVPPRPGNPNFKKPKS